MKRFTAITVALVLCAAMLAGCAQGEGDKAQTVPTTTTAAETTTEASTEASSEETTEASTEETTEATTESVDDDPMADGKHHLPLKDREDDARYAVEVAMQLYLQETYGDKVADARIYVEKIYSYEDEQKAHLEDMDIDKTAFQVTYDLLPAGGTEENIAALLVGNGEYNEKTGWVEGKVGFGILEPNPKGDEPEYIITEMSTAF
ncbi:MAG: hypothetical protein J6X33_02225 [Clostridiales bacterium]|nr:hypothetical protein [Clostridiales bacterium]